MKCQDHKPKKKKEERKSTNKVIRRKRFSLFIETEEIKRKERSRGILSQLNLTNGVTMLVGTRAFFFFSTLSFGMIVYRFRIFFFFPLPHQLQQCNNNDALRETVLNVGNQNFTK